MRQEPWRFPMDFYKSVFTSMTRRSLTSAWSVLIFFLWSVLSMMILFVFMAVFPLTYLYWLRLISYREQRSLSKLAPCATFSGQTPFLSNTKIFRVFGSITRPEDAATFLGNLISKTAADTFLERNKLMTIIRAHEAEFEGYKYFKWGDKAAFP